MNVFLWILAVMAALLVVAAGAGMLAARNWGQTVRKRVVVVLDTERTIEGVLLARRGPLLVLRDAQVLVDGAKVAADGEMIIERSRIEWVQVVG